MGSEEDIFECVPFFSQNSRIHHNYGCLTTEEVPIPDMVCDMESTGITLKWKELSILVPQPQETFQTSFMKMSGWPKKATSEQYKRILNNVSGLIYPGTLTAIMGASGCGKTTLLKALALRSSKETITHGQVTINGHPLEHHHLNHITGFVHQHDYFYETLTAQEHLHFTATLRLGSILTKEEIDQRVQEILLQTGLNKCKHSRIGSHGMTKTLSGGERKRLAFATEVIADPLLLFCDEPTTGLDSYMARTVIGVLQNMAANGKTVICSIHQPSSEIFSMFTELLLLAEGRIAYLGPAKDAQILFEHIGYICPPMTNPADFYIRTLSVVPGEEDNSLGRIKSICDGFASSEFASAIDEQHDSSTTSELIGLFLSMLYTNTSADQVGVASLVGVAFLFITENMYPSMYSVINLFPEEMPVFIREFQNGLYGVGIFYLSKVLTLIPALVIEPLMFVLVTYWIIGLNNSVSSFFLTLATVVMLSQTASACGCFFSALFKDVPTAITCVVPFDYITIITGGLFMNLKSLPWYVAWVQYFSLFRYSNEALSIAQWSEIKNITCDDSINIPCVRNGEEMLLNYGFDKADLPWCFMGLGLLYVGFHVLGYFALIRKTCTF